MQINNNYYKNYAYTNPNFNGYKTVFTKKLDEILISKRQPDINDEKFLIDKLQEFIRKKMRPNKIVGQGFHGVVYKIDDRYVLKVSHKDKPYADMLDKIKEPKFSDLKTYYGEPVAKFYDVQILKNVSSKSLHIPAGIPQKDIGLKTKKECSEYYEKIYLPLFSSLPQKSFDAIAKDCSILNKMGDDEISYSFDYLNPNNFVLVGKTLRITDVINKEFYKDPNTIAQLLYSFIQKTDLDGYATYTKAGEPYRRALMKKIVLAGMKHNLPIDDSQYGKKIWEVTLNKLCNVNETVDNVINNLQKIQVENKNPKKRIELAERYLNYIYKEKL